MEDLGDFKYGGGLNGMGKGRQGRARQEKVVQTVGNTSQNVVERCEKEELGRIFHFFK